MLLPRLDRYVAKSVLGSYAASLVFLVALMVMFDTLRAAPEYVRNVSENGLSTLQLIGMVGYYHYLNLPFLFVTVAPFVTVIACMFAVSRLMGQNEIVPMLFTGRSMLRILLPAVLTAVASGLAMRGSGEWVLSPRVESRDRVQSLLESGKEKTWVDEIVVRPSGDTTRVLFCGRFFHDKERIENLVLYERGGKGTAREDVLLVNASAGVWDKSRSDWRLESGTEQSSNERRPREWLGLHELTPDLVWRAGKSSREVNDLSYSELMDLHFLKPARADYLIAFHRHITFPLANLVLLSLALPFAVHFERSRRIERVIFAIAVCALYLVVDLTCQNAGLRGWMHPLVSAWLPTLVFGSLGLVHFGGMRT